MGDGHSRLLDHVVDVGVLKSKSAVVAEALDVSSQELLWFTRLEMESTVVLSASTNRSST